MGTKLGLSQTQLNNIAANKKADNTAGVSNAFMDMLAAWLRQDLESSWTKLADALKERGDDDLSQRIRSLQGASLEEI